jgi:hypothetical protein
MLCIGEVLICIVLKHEGQSNCDVCLLLVLLLSMESNILAMNVFIKHGESHVYNTFWVQTYLLGANNVLQSLKLLDVELR